MGKKRKKRSDASVSDESRPFRASRRSIFSEYLENLGFLPGKSLNSRLSRLSEYSLGRLRKIGRQLFGRGSVPQHVCTEDLRRKITARILLKADARFNRESCIVRFNKRRGRYGKWEGWYHPLSKTQKKAYKEYVYEPWGWNRRIWRRTKYLNLCLQHRKGEERLYQTAIRLIRRGLLSAKEMYVPRTATGELHESFRDEVRAARDKRKKPEGRKPPKLRPAMAKYYAWLAKQDNGTGKKKKRKKRFNSDGVPLMRRKRGNRKV